MFGTKHTKEAQAWIKKVAGAIKPQERATGGKGPNTNSSSAGTHPKNRSKISNAYKETFK